jgi:alpha-glucosidase (family GH31 glycosyl hydrolase)
VVWSGDPTTDWDPVDGLPAMVSQGLNYGYSGIGIYGSDVGGFFSITAPPTSPELLARWLELGAFSGVMRTESEGFTAPQWSQPRAQIWDPSIEPVWRRYAKLRTQLYPYLAQAAARYEADGVPLMEALGLAYPQDPASWRGPARYLFGPSLLVAPVTAPGVRALQVPLPPGRWRSFWQSVSYRSADGSFHLRRAPALAGGGSVSAAAPLDQVPVFVRDGTLLALLPPDVATLAPYGRGVVHLADRAGRLRLLAWPRGRTSTLALGTRLVSKLSRRQWSLSIGGRRPASLALEAQLAWRPRLVSFAGRRVSPRRWRYQHGVLSVTVHGRGVLVASGR